MFAKIFAIAFALFGLARAGVVYNNGYAGYGNRVGYGGYTSVAKVVPAYNGAYGGYLGSYTGLGYGANLYNGLGSAVSYGYAPYGYAGYRNGAYGGYGYGY